MAFGDGLLHVGALVAPATAGDFAAKTVVPILHHIIDTHSTITIIIVIALPKGAKAVDGHHPVVAKVPTERFQSAAVEITAKHHALLVRIATVVHLVAGQVHDRLAVLVLELATGVAEVEVQPAVRTEHEIMDSMVVLAASDAAEERLFLVRFIVAINIGKDLHLVAGGNDYLGVFTIHRA